MSGDIIISGNSCSINCWTSRWTCDNFSLTCETWLRKSDVQLLRNNITPGLTKEMYNVLGLPHFYDQTFKRENTLRLIPNVSCGSNLPFMRGEKTVFCKNIMTNCLSGDKNWINVKLEFFTSGTSEL